MIENGFDIFMVDFSIYRDSYTECLSNLKRVLERCEDTNLELEVEKTKIEFIEKLPHPTSTYEIQNFLSHARFY
ncbi:RNA-directed DNA polymerase-like protein [Gossypium australe]|uniref:RNA-directed DNA polymerase-like protein n=1 Tax=Gossypium australe TaxID=47621 RepID=A0A5B6VAX3_9ROSI|nr:RNA-directed DNA polymerase-like protein [Gossypium australe]